MSTDLDIDPDALAAYHIVLASLKHPASRQNEAMRLLTPNQIDWVLKQLRQHPDLAIVRAVQWMDANCFVDLTRVKDSVTVSLLFPFKHSRHEEAAARTQTEDEDDGFVREKMR